MMMMMMMTTMTMTMRISRDEEFSVRLYSGFDIRSGSAALALVLLSFTRFFHPDDDYEDMDDDNNDDDHEDDKIRFWCPCPPPS